MDILCQSFLWLERIPLAQWPLPYPLCLFLPQCRESLKVGKRLPESDGPSRKRPIHREPTMGTVCHQDSGPVHYQKWDRAGPHENEEVKYINIESFLQRMGTCHIKVKRKGIDFQDQVELLQPSVIRQWMVGYQKEENVKNWIETLPDVGKFLKEFDRETKYLNKGLPQVTTREKKSEMRQNQVASRKFEWRNKQDASTPSTIATACSSSSYQKKDTSSNTMHTSYPTDGKLVIFT